MSHMSPCKLLVVAVLLFPMSVLAQSGSGGGSAGGSSAGGASVGATGAAPSVGAGTAAVSRVTGPGNVGGLNNSGNDPSGAGNAAKAPNTPGTNSAGTANSSDQRPPLGVPHCDRQRSEQLATLLAERQEAASTAPLLRDLRGRATTRFGRKIPKITKSIKRSKASAKDADCRKTCAQRMKSPVVIVLDVESPQLAMVAANN
jgi:hypothetical protein